MHERPTSLVNLPKLAAHLGASEFRVLGQMGFKYLPQINGKNTIFFSNLGKNTISPQQLYCLDIYLFIFVDI